MVWQFNIGSLFAQPSMQARLNRTPGIDLAVPRVLLFGPERCGKTSLMFQFALHLAASKGQEVWLLCDQASLDQHPPLCPPAADQDAAALGRIKFKYASDLHQLKNLGACLHLCPNPPAALLVDNLTQLARNTRLSDRRAQDVAITKAIAFLADGLEHIKEQRSQEVLLFVSDTTGADGALPNLYLLQRWFPLMLAVTGGSGPGQMLTLQASPQGKQVLPPAAARAAVHYSLTQSYVHVESVQDGGGFG